MGNWRREAVADTDTRNANKGDKFSKDWRFAWTANKNAVLITQLVSVNGKTVGQLDSLFGWDKGKQQIVGAGFSTDGGVGGGWTINADDETLTITANSSNWVFKKMGKDTLVVIDNRGNRREYRRVKK